MTDNPSVNIVLNILAVILIAWMIYLTLDMKNTEVIIPTGWEVYQSGEYYGQDTSFVVPAKRKTHLQNSGEIFINSEKPEVRGMYDKQTQKFMPLGVGDAYEIRVDFWARGKASGCLEKIELILESGGQTVVRRNIICRQTENSTFEKISVAFPIYTHKALVREGVEFKVMPSCDAEIKSVVYLFIRLHKGKHDQQ